MRYINLHFTYLLNYLLTSVIFDFCLTGLQSSDAVGSATGRHPAREELGVG